MKITKINIPEDTSIGLKEIKMSRLNNLVLIAGKNGSGKSRLLGKIHSILQVKPTIAQFEDKKRYIKILQQNLDNYIIQRADFISKYESLALDINKSTVADWDKKIEQAIEELERNESELNWDLIETSEHGHSYFFSDFVPKNLELQDSNQLTIGMLEHHALQLDNTFGVAVSQQGTLAKIQFVQNQWFNATHQSSVVLHEERNILEENYTRLLVYIKIFLNTDLKRDPNGNATLFGFKLGEAKLSNGQKILLQFCLTIYSQEHRLDEMMIFLDEPENHLHPEALIEVITKLSSAITNGQIWIATHSINLLAHVDPTSIWYIENGLVKYSGNIPKQVLNGLIGNDDEISKLEIFLSLPAVMATSHFAFECLFNPKTIETGAEDPQTKQIIEAIGLLLEKNNQIKILDFGAGKGRLLSTIKDFENQYNKPISEWLDYYAYDLPSDDESVCRQIIHEIYNSDDNRYFNNKQALMETISHNSFDLIVMCNVFHEIDPKEWLNLFDKHNIVLSSLKADGTLLIVEDQLLAVGEKAYQNGFLVFDKIQFKKLFNISEDYKVLDARNDGRLKAHLISANHLVNISDLTRIDALENLMHFAKEKIKELRNDVPSYKNGKLHGFWVQQLANAQLALSEFRTN